MLHKWKRSLARGISTFIKYFLAIDVILLNGNYQSSPPSKYSLQADTAFWLGGSWENSWRTVSHKVRMVSDYWKKWSDGCLVSLKTIWWSFRYEAEFFHNVVNGHDIVSWGAVDQSRPNEQSDELIGFVTVRIVPAKESEVSLGGVHCR